MYYAVIKHDGNLRTREKFRMALKYLACRTEMCIFLAFFRRTEATHEVSTELESRATGGALKK